MLFCSFAMHCSCTLARLTLTNRPEHVWDRYLAAFAYGLTLLISGEMGGDETPIEMTLGVIGIMLGAFFFAYIIGSFSSILHNLATDRDAYEV